MLPERSTFRLCAGLAAGTLLAAVSVAAPQPKAKPNPAAKPAAAKPAPKATAVAPASAGSNWPMFRGNAKHTAFSPVNVNVSTIKPAWTWSGTADTVISSPSVYGNTVYFGTRDKVSDGTVRGSLYAVSLETGKTIWRYNVADKARTIMTHTAKEQPATNTDPEAVGWVDSSPCVTGSLIYFTSRDGALHAVTMDGRLKWRLRTGGLDTSSPTAVDGTVYFGSGYPNKDFWAVDAASGVVRWRRRSGVEGNPKRPGQFVYSSQAVTDGTVYASACDGGFYALDAVKGKLKWRYETAGGVFWHSPTIAGDILVAAPGDFDTAVYGINRTTGALAWKYDSGLQQSYVSSPAYDGSTVYLGIGTPDQQLVALDAKTGKLKWKYTTGYSTNQSYTSSPAVTNNVIFVGTAQPKMTDPPSGRLIALDKASGELLWEVKLPKPVVSSPCIAGNYVIVGCMDGSVYAYKWES
jgi:outer membrane protein assembly factor BamB